MQVRTLIIHHLITRKILLICFHTLVLLIIIIFIFGPYRWWRESDVPNKLPFVRDRMMECCFWGLAVYFEPQYRTGRELMAKLIIIMTAIDDTYDAYGTFDELELFTETIERSISTSYFLVTH